MRTLHTALDTMIATACAAVAVLVFFPVLLLARAVKAVLPQREAEPFRAPNAVRWPSER